MSAISRRGVITIVMGLLLSVVTLPGAAVERAGYDGMCLPKDSNGVTFVIDFQGLDGNDGLAAPTIIRCSPVENNDATIKRTGLQAMVDAGISASGTVRWGDDYPTQVSFVCRIEGRPTAAEPMYLAASATTYHEPCHDTPPAAAYWSYWHADGQGGTWKYSNYGIMARNVIPGGFEGWSFSQNADSGGEGGSNPTPRVTPLIVDTALSVTVDSSELTLGQSATITWNADAGDYLAASGAWNGQRRLVGSETVTPQRAGTYTFQLDTVGAERPASRHVTVRVLDDDAATPPGHGPAESQSAQARSTAGWLVNELAPAGHMPGPDVGTDWGLTIDTLFALYAAGTGASAVKEIADQVSSHAGVYMGAELFGDADARIGGSTAKLLLASVVAGRDPQAYGTSRFLASDDTYNMRQETLDLILKSGAQKGRLINRGTGSDDTNIFAQSLAVVGLARSGGVPEDAVAFLRTQQCSSGFFRMFYQDGLSCDAGRGTPDPDGTALAVQAMMAARDSGVEGLDRAIDRGLDWLLGAQGKNGSIGGGAGTASANSNSTGLLAQALSAGSQAASGARKHQLKAAHELARNWVLTIHARSATAAKSQLDTRREFGAIAYNKRAFADAKQSGIGSGMRDQWRRASAQAIFALAPVSFADLGKTDPSGDPVEQNQPDATPGSSEGGGAAAPPGTSGTTVTSAKKSTTSKTPMAMGGEFLVSHLVDNDHIEVTVDGIRYVDYDATTDVLFTLRALGEQPKAISAMSAFLLHPRSIAAYAYGKPYEESAASYAEPLARLSLVARFWRSDGQAPATIDKTISRLDSSLGALRSGHGSFADVGRFGDQSGSTSRQAWAVLATAAADGGANVLAAAASKLLAAQCSDGTFAAVLSSRSCATGDLGATSIALQALNAQAPLALAAEPATAGAVLGHDDLRAVNVAPEAWEATRAPAMQRAAIALLTRTDVSGLADDLEATGQLAAGRQFMGLDATNTAHAVAALQTKDGGLPRRANGKHGDFETTLAAGFALAAKSWTGAARAPVTAIVRLPLAEHAKPEAGRSQAVSRRDSTAAAWGFGSLIAVTVLAWTASQVQRRRRSSKGSTS